MTMPARSELLLHLVIDSIPQRVFWKDRDSVYLGCNRSFARDAGLDDPALIVGKTDLELAWKATGHLYVADDRLVMESNMAKVDIEEPMTFTDGRTIWLRTSKVPLHDESGAVLGVLGTYEDITEQRQAASDLQESEERFRATFEQAAVGIAHVAPDGRWLRVNERLCEMVGYTREELLAGSFQEITHPDDLPADLENVRKVLAGDIRNFGMEKRYIRKDRTAAWIALTVALARDAEGRPKYFISVIEDIEPRRRAEAERTRLAEIVEQASEGVIMTDVDGNITYVNPAFERISGYSRTEVEGQNPRFLKSGRQDAKFYTELWRTITSGGVWSGHFINRRKDGRLFEEEGSIFPVRDHAGQIVSYVAIKRDVTEEVRLNEQLLQAQKMESVGRLAGGIAHDFNNLLTAILGYAELAAGRLKPEDPSLLDLSEIDKAAQRAADLTRQLLAFSRKQVLELRVIDLNRVVSNTHKLLRRLIGEDVELVLSLKERLGSVKADTGQIEQVLLNLAVNSRDAMPKGGKLTIETSEIELDESYSTFHFDVPPGPYVVLAVSDTGTGMDAKTLSHVFEPFFTTKEAGKGTGLGLSTVYGVVKQSGGHVTAYSEPGVGTTFKIYLPRVEDAPETDRTSSAPAALAGGTQTILVVEDEEAIRRLTCRVLEAQGYTVLSAASGGEALLLLEKHAREIHLLITDVVMPAVSGRELARSAAALRPLMKVLFMSGYTDNVIVHHGVLDAGTAFLQKPFTPRSLAQKVREVLDAR
jgi:two-component system cell cycle sensor histidine kinase/response regulator CckA